MPMPIRLVAAAQADAAGSTPRLKAFSANQTQWKPCASADFASVMQRPGSIPPCRRTLSFGRSLTSPSRTSRPRADRPGLYAAGTRARARLGKMRVHDAPLAGLLAEHHGGAGDEFIAAVMDILRRRLLAGPVAPGATMAPDHRHLVGHDTA